MNIMIIGAGGVTSHMLPQLLKMCPPEGPKSNIIVVDGDELEQRNLDRQLFNERHVGINKARALRFIYRDIVEYPHMLTAINVKQVFDAFHPEVVFVAVDNHEARMLVLDYLDEVKGTIGIFGCNEYFDAQAYVYQSEWINSKADPRIRYPEITLPSKPTVNCQGEAQESAPQLAIANAMSGCMMMHLFYLHVAKAKEITDPEAKKEIPYDIRRNLFEYQTINWNTTES